MKTRKYKKAIHTISELYKNARENNSRKYDDETFDQCLQDLQECVDRVRKLEDDLDLLEYDVKSLRQALERKEIELILIEEDHDRSLRENEKLDSALEKACGKISLLFDYFEDVRNTWDLDDWKEWCLDDDQD